MIQPKAAIRRFDVFAEYNRQQAIKRGMRADQAKGYGLWLAKIVAARRYRTALKPGSKETKSKGKTGHGKWRRLSGKPQTDKLFEKEIVNRMGREFYRTVFSKSIRRAIAQRQSYQDIRDQIRQNWKSQGLSDKKLERGSTREA